MASLACACAVPAGALAAGTLYAAPGIHPGAPCTQAEPCEIPHAIEIAKVGDSVQLADGTYAVGFGGVSIQKEVSLGGIAGEKPVLQTETGDLQVTGSADASIHDLRLEGTGGLRLESGSGERLFVDSTAPANPTEQSAACTLAGDALLRDSVCWAHDETGGSTTAALRAIVFGSGVKGTAVLRNVTAYAATAKGDALLLEATAAGNLTVDARNVIAHSDHGLDVGAFTDADKSVESKVVTDISNSSFATVHAESGVAEVPSPSGAGNSPTPPILVNPGEGDFHEMEGSPTLDLGAIDGFLGQSDIDGDARSQPKCLGEGSSSLPDAGAYELRPIAKCPPPAAVPPVPPTPRKPVFRLLKLTLNRASGQGSVRMEVPGAGVASLTGSGVKLVTRKVSEAGTVALPILPWAISRVRLGKNGKLKVRLKLSFEPTAGPPATLKRPVTLRKSTP